MARFHYVILSQAVPGREAEFDSWYDDTHLADVVRVDGVVSARRFNIETAIVTEFDAPQWRSVAIYEIESDDPVAVMDAIADAAKTPAMLVSTAFSRSGMVQILASETKAVVK